MSPDAQVSPPTLRGAATRERIVDAAAYLVYQEGVAHTSLDDVLKATGTSKSQLYHYFRDKRALLQAVVDRQTETILDSQRSALTHLDTMADLRAWRDHIVSAKQTQGSAGGCPLGSLAVELADDSQLREQVAGGFQRWTALLSIGFTKMSDRGELRPGTDPQALATAVMAALQGGLLLADNRRSTAPLELALDMAVDHVQAHVAPKPRRRR